MLHRSLSPDAEVRFVNVAEWASPAAFQAATAQPDFPGSDMPFPAHPGLYQVVREDQPPAEDPGGVVLINAFEVPPDGDDAFLASWEAVREVLMPRCPLCRSALVTITFGLEPTLFASAR